MKAWLKTYTGKSLGQTEIKIIGKAMDEHEGSFQTRLDIFGDPVALVAKNIEPDDHLQSIIGIALKIADGCLEASGYRVVERRCFFAGHERMVRGDLKGILKYPDDCNLAVIGESLVRLYKKLVITEYPAWVRPLGEKLHSVQYRFL